MMSPVARLAYYLIVWISNERVLGFLHRLQDQRRVGGDGAWHKRLDELKVSGIGNDGGKLFELFKLAHDNTTKQDLLIANAFLPF